MKVNYTRAFTEQDSSPEQMPTHHISWRNWTPTPGIVLQNVLPVLSTSILLDFLVHTWYSIVSCNEGNFSFSFNLFNSQSINFSLHLRKYVRAAAVDTS